MEVFRCQSKDNVRLNSKGVGRVDVHFKAQIFGDMTDGVVSEHSNLTRVVGVGGPVNEGENDVLKHLSVE
ncbi:unnamed protein product [Taenia asiatica]|uniref:Uncharacterized protein n=1 Tax=Taenia asiatica TaxID=60517 RepID=A0A0R3WD04_TAEAS|nr:unnamed protein product [Taenia asiatica]